MSFALPLALALTALTLPIIGFYILKVRLRRVPVSTNLFWKQIFDEKPPRSLWQNFRHLMSLLLQLLMLLLLVLSIADPYFPWQLLQARRLVLVIDNSASMRTTDVVPSRFEAARSAVRDVIAGLRFRDEVALVLAGRHPDVIMGMTNHIPTLYRALDGITVSDSPTDLVPAIELGKQLLGDHPHGQVLVFSDGCVDAETELKDAVQTTEGTKEDDPKQELVTNKVIYRLFGTNASNVGITQFQVRRSLIDPIGYEALASVKNASAMNLKCRLELTLDDIPIDVLPLNLKPGETWSRSIEKTSLDGGELVATLTQIHEADRNDDNVTKSESEASPRGTNASGVDASALNLNSLQTDDSAWAILPPRQIQKVLIVTPGNLFLQKVFEANPLVKIEIVKEFPTEWPTDSILVLHGQVPTVLPRGNVFVIDPAGPSDHWDLGEVLENPIVTEQDKKSPLMTHIRLDNVLMPHAKQLQFKVAPHVLAATVTGDPVYAEVKRPDGKCLVLSVNLEESDLAFRTAFPILVTNSLGWFAGQNGELRESFATGTVANIAIEMEADGESEDLVLRSPSENVTVFQGVRPTSPPPTKTEPYTGKIGPLNEVGIWRVAAKVVGDQKSDTTPVDPLFEVAVNLASPRETDLQPSSELQDSSKNASSVSGWLSRPVWFYLISVACALTTFEWFLYQRRLIT